LDCKRIKLENDLNISLHSRKEGFVTEQNVPLKDEFAEYVYKKTGYQTLSSLFMEDGMTHTLMIKELPIKH